MKIFTFLLLSQLPMLESNVIKIAHLQPNDPSIIHEPHVLKLCASDLKEKNILPSDINLK